MLMFLKSKENYTGHFCHDPDHLKLSEEKEFKPAIFSLKEKIRTAYFICRITRKFSRATL